MSKAHRILVSIFHDVRGGRALISELARVGQSWQNGCLLHLLSPAEGLEGVWQRGPWDAAVIQVTDARCRDIVAAAPCPVVLFDPRDELLPELDRVCLDHAATGALAAQHLLATGRRQFAYLGFDGAKISELREAAFLAALRKAGHEPRLLRIPIALNHPRTRIANSSLPDVRRFVESLPMPSAVFCGNDELARAILEEALPLGISVPTDLAILGADDDDLLCLTCTPTLSSVHVPYHVAGAQIAHLLKRRMIRYAKGTCIHVAPKEVIMRDSTRVAPGGDSAVEKSMRRMHQDFSADLRMTTLAAEVGLSLSTLERRFKTALGVTPLQELRRLRLHEARRLLTETDQGIREIAHQTGFQSAARFCISFRQETQTSPTDYRRTHRNTGAR